MKNQNVRLLDEARAREARLDQELGQATFGSSDYWRVTNELDAVRREILALLRTLQRNPPRPENRKPQAPGRIFLICPLHSKPGNFVAAITKPGPEGGTIAICPHCIDLGKKIADERGMTLVKRGGDGAGA